MAAKTAQQLVTAAYRKSGAVSSGQDPTSAESADGLEAMNAMLTSWSEQNITVPYRVEDVIPLITGKTEYTMGSGGDVNTDRPLSMADAWLTDSGGDVSYRFEITMMLREFTRIANKNESSRPGRGWYEPVYPLGKLTLDVNPDQTYTLHVWSLKQLSEFSALASSSTLPPAYDRAIIFNLALEIAGELGSPMDPLNMKLANDAFKSIRNANLARRVNNLAMDSALRRRTIYDIHSDGF
ncbi:MAG: hypothetical protein BMS9Abin36_2087 [Gammaproteobacteria bacterium]|nr:MAG: hypothetical protein BMS9Abin36_2087 [Gammaproteobacteria bacterium]